MTKLKQVGLVLQRSAGEAATYDVPGTRLVIDHEPANARQQTSLLKLIAACLRIAERDLRAAFEAGIARYRRRPTRNAPPRNAWGARVKGWLTQDELAEVNQHLEAVSELVTAGAKRPGADLHAVTFVLTPIQPTQRQRSS